MDAPTPPLLTISRQGSRQDLVATGAWVSANAATLEEAVAAAEADTAGVQLRHVDASGIVGLDTLGALLLKRLLHGSRAPAGAAKLHGLPEKYRTLFGRVDGAGALGGGSPPRRSRFLDSMESVGRWMPIVRDEAASLLTVLGALFTTLLRALARLRTFRLTSTVYQLDRVGWQATPLILLITFLIGCIIAQQGFFHFRRFGAEDYVVDLVGILVLREIGVLLVAIMVAGRSGSSYTAELGAMKMREELDAVRTMGLDPVEILMLPRVLALIVAMPILTLLADLSAIVGGGFVAAIYAGMSPEVFIDRLSQAISLTHFQVGMIKAPFMALVVGIVACSEGLKVAGSTESLGERTTSSVVKSIFLVIVMDGLFAIFFASIGI